MADPDVDMRRTGFQSGHPAAMIQAVSAIVHLQSKPQAAYEHYLAARPGQGQEEKR